MTEKLVQWTDITTLDCPYEVQLNVYTDEVRHRPRRMRSSDNGDRDETTVVRTAWVRGNPPTD